MSDHNHSVPGEPVRPIEESFGQACPECGGAMKAFRMGSLLEYRCHIGHRMGLQTMIAEKSRLVEHALEIALSQSEELGALLQTALKQSDEESADALHQQLAKRKGELQALRAISRNRKDGQAAD